MTITRDSLTHDFVAPHRQTLSSYIVATASDAASSFTGKAISNEAGEISAVGVTMTATAAGGTTPQVQHQIVGTNRERAAGETEANWLASFQPIVVSDEQGNSETLQTSATTITSTSVIQWTTANLRPKVSFPSYIAVRELLTGTSPTRNSTTIVRVDFCKHH